MDCSIQNYFNMSKKEKMRYIILLMIILIGPGVFGQADHFTWPGNARAAVCLTYDDGMDTHLEYTIDGKT